MKKILISPYIVQSISLQGPLVPRVDYLDLLVASCLPIESNDSKLTTMYEKYNKELYRYCICRVSSSDTALDIVQETFKRVWSYLERGNAVEHDKSFLYTITRNLIIDEYRKKKSVSLELLIGTDIEPAIVTEETIYQRDDVLQVTKCINQLSTVYSSVLRMRYIDDSSITHIAETLHITENVVSVRIYRGLCKLRPLIRF